ncbi:MAG: hypothetical protein PF637_02510 [Spirochaetes bacterium]|jgi:hypothetical protein|nr:hypothetical protein [Spirochaetota bacterium]
MAIDSANKMILALKLAGNDADKARRLVSGDLKDVRVVYGKFSIEAAEIYGLFQLFFHLEDENLLHVALLTFSDQAEYDKVKLTDNWKLFFTVLSQLQQTPSLTDSDDFLTLLTDSIDGYQLVYDVVDNDQEHITETLTEIIEKSYGLPGAECTIDFSDLSTLEMVDLGIPLKLASDQKQEVAQERPEIEKLAAHTVEGALIIAPVRGTYINDIKIGDIIKVSLISHDDISKKIITALNAYDTNNNFLPIRGRVKEITPLQSGGFRIYCLIAKNILARIIEEENIKAEMWDFSKVTKGKGDNSFRHLGLIALLSLVVIIALVVLVVLL